MQFIRSVCAIAVLGLVACGPPRGGIGGGVPNSDTDAGAATTDAPVTPPSDAPVTPPSDAPVTPPSDVPVTPPSDVPVTPPSDVPVTSADVVAASCGDGVCNGGETCESCRMDCASTCPPPPDVPTVRCGDGVCNGAEACTDCPSDCGACPARCGDGMCNGTETCMSCASDCGACPARCGDGMCNGTETCMSCASDCGGCTMTGAVTDPCGSGVAQGPSRDCGWRMGMTFSCSPGRATMVGCSGSTGSGSLCQPSYGVCTGDPVIRVCPGTAPCRAAQALMALSGSMDDACGTCPSAYVTCPSSGQIHVLSGDYDSNQPTQRGTCAPAVR